MQSLLALAGVNGVTVESDPSIGTSTPGDNSALVIGLSIGGAFLGIILIVAIYFVAKGPPLPPPSLHSLAPCVAPAPHPSPPRVGARRIELGATPQHQDDGIPGQSGDAPDVGPQWNTAWKRP